MTGRLGLAGRVALVALFFGWGMVSVMVDMTIPYFKTAFGLGYRDALLVQSSFFLAYLLLSRLAGRITAATGFRHGAMIGLGLMAIGAIGLALATLAGRFIALLPSVFVIASGITFLQVSANPLAAAMGGTRSAAGNLSFAQGFNSLGTVAAPLIAAAAFLGAGPTVDGDPLAPVRNLFLLLATALVALLLFSRWAFGEARSLGTSPVTEGDAPFDRYASSRLAAGSLAIFAYVGAEVSIASVLVNLLEDPVTLGLARDNSAQLAAVFWGGALLGRFAGVPILMRYRRGRVLLVAASAATLFSLGGMNAGGVAAAGFVLAIGLFNSIQFPTIFAIASSDLAPEGRAKAAGWLCTGIVGGAVIPLAFGAIADARSLQWALIAPALCYAYVAWFAYAYGDRPAAGAAFSATGGKVGD